MSLKETPLTRWYWQQVGGLLIEEYPILKAGLGVSPRYLDGLIVLGEESRISEVRDFRVEGRDVIVVQTKASRLGMYLMGQCLFSRDLVMRLNPKSVTSIALCTEDDSVLRPLLEAHEGCKVVVYCEDPGDLK